MTRAQRQGEVVAECERRRADASLGDLRGAAVQRDERARQRRHRHAHDRLIHLAERFDAVRASRQQKLVVPATGTRQRGVYVHCTVRAVEPRVTSVLESEKRIACGAVNVMSSLPP